MFCGKCGKELPGGAGFCPDCGERVTLNPPPMGRKAGKKPWLMVAAAVLVMALLGTILGIVITKAKEPKSPEEAAMMYAEALCSVDKKYLNAHTIGGYIVFAQRYAAYDVGKISAILPQNPYESQEDFCEYQNVEVESAVWLYPELLSAYPSICRNTFESRADEMTGLGHNYEKFIDIEKITNAADVNVVVSYISKNGENKQCTIYLCLIQIGDRWYYNPYCYYSSRSLNDYYDKHGTPPK